MRRPAFLRHLRADRRGVSVVEFALIAPVMLAMLLGLCDLMYQAYVQSILTGTMQKAGRDSSLEGNATTGAALDDQVAKAVREIAKNATFTPSRVSYTSFSLIKPEYIYDKNGNGKLDSKECWDDVNGNDAWDEDPGRESQGGADDVTVYTMTVSYPHLFPMAGMFGWSKNQTVSATTLLKNQPYKAQTSNTIEKVCKS